MIARIFIGNIVAALALGTFIPASTNASDIVPAPPQAKAIALKGVTIHPVSGPDIASGTIVFDNGKITAIGAEVVIPGGAEVIDATGKHVYPHLDECVGYCPSAAAGEGDCAERRHDSSGERARYRLGDDRF